ncbi:hypothetical protein ACFL1W_01885 [Candidatus Margulisiibacteriota bacterium]
MKRKIFFLFAVVALVILAALWFMGCGKVAEGPTTTTTSTSLGTSTTTTTTTTTTTIPPGEVWYKSGNADFNVLGGHSSVVSSFSPDRMWVIGGITTGFKLRDDVYYSYDGISWEAANTAPEFGGLMFHGNVVFNDNLWLIAGRTVWNPETATNEVWYSSNGVNWTSATAEAAFPPVFSPTALVFNDQMWLLGGNLTSSTMTNEVWYSSNGVTWSNKDTYPKFTPVSAHSSVVFNNKMWVIAGRTGGEGANPVLTTEVWYSDTGKAWTLEAVAPFTARQYHTSLVYDNKMWVIGGMDDSLDSLGDVWYTSDGSSWTQATASAEFPAVAAHSSVVFDNKMWVIGGANDYAGDVITNEVWYSPGP